MRDENLGETRQEPGVAVLSGVHDESFITLEDIRRTVRQFTSTNVVNHCSLHLPRIFSGVRRSTQGFIFPYTFLVDPPFLFSTIKNSTKVPLQLALFPVEYSPEELKWE